MLQINNLKAPLDANEVDLKNAAAIKLNCRTDDITGFKIVKKAVDARNKSNVHFVYGVRCEDLDLSVADKDVEHCLPAEKLVYKIKDDGVRPIVVGSGPAGMFAGLALAEANLRPIILERGSKVEVRHREVDVFWQTRQLNSESNVQFGEGGAGTFSDGKLTTGIKKDKYTAKVIEELYAAGAPQEILYLAKPHIGTDNLRKVVKNIRKKIISLGGEYMFNTKLEDLIIKDDKIIGVKINNMGKKAELAAKRVFLAIGHSARDTFEMLHNRGVYMEQKPFAVGVRIEHKQSAINKAQYGKFAESKYLGAADYKLAVHLAGGRSVYTFCMCPGGRVVAAASETEKVVTNGMSEFARNGENANSALLVGVGAQDFGSAHPLAGVSFQRMLEERAFILGGKTYYAPAQLAGDFLQNKESKAAKSIRPSYLPGVAWCNLAALFPPQLTQTLRSGIVEMGKKLHGFDNADAVLTGVESRSSSPVRIVRDETMQSNIKGLYPCGEGAGYAGGITSSAADALKVIHSLCTE